MNKDEEVIYVTLTEQEAMDMIPKCPDCGGTLHPLGSSCTCHEY